MIDAGIDGFTGARAVRDFLIAQADEIERVVPNKPGLKEPLTVTTHESESSRRRLSNKIAPMPSSHNPVLDREKVTRPDVAKVAKGFVSIVMSTPSEEEAVTKCLAKYPVLRTLNEAHP